MRFITVTIGCDWPGCDVVVPEGDDAIIERAIDVGRGPKKFAVCKPHNDDVDEMLNPLLAKALKAEAKTASPAPKRTQSGNVSAATLSPSGVTCLVPGCRRVLGSRQGLGQHVIRTHKYDSIAAYDADHPSP